MARQTKSVSKLALVKDKDAKGDVINPTRVIAPGRPVEYDGWLDKGRKLGKAHGAIGFQLGDWWNEGHAILKAKAAAGTKNRTIAEWQEEAAVMLGYHPQTLRWMGQTARAFPDAADRERPGVTMGHFRTLAPLKVGSEDKRANPRAVTAYLAKIESDGMTVKALENEMVAKGQRNRGVGAPPGPRKSIAASAGGNDESSAGGDDTDDVNADTLPTRMFYVRTRRAIADLDAATDLAGMLSGDDRAKALSELDQDFRRLEKLITDLRAEVMANA